ncbi:MAG: type II/IV secretion system protein, partial [Chloroflexi bacterium]|nr:type II/IV secretion system protein [Chloroflexota bacterium]
FYTGRGCNMCSRTGYIGRIGVFEILTVNDSIRKLVQSGSTAEEIKAEAVRAGMVTLRRDGMLKARDGLTSPREVMRNVFTLV